MDRNNPYEAAFEGYLQAKGLCYVGIDESRRTKLEDLPLKNLDFIVLGNRGVRLLIDVKGRQFPGGKPEKPRYVWENWATQEDLDGLRSWTEVFGPGYLAMFLFSYRIGPTIELPADTSCLEVPRSAVCSSRRRPRRLRRPHEGAQPEVGDRQLADRGLSGRGPSLPGSPSLRACRGFHEWRDGRWRSTPQP